MKAKKKKLHVDERVFELIKDMLNADLSHVQVARALGLSSTTISKVAKSTDLAEYKTELSKWWREHHSKEQLETASTSPSSSSRNIEWNEWDKLRDSLDRIEAKCDEVIAAFEKRRWRI